MKKTLLALGLSALLNLSGCGKSTFFYDSVGNHTIKLEVSDNGKKAYMVCYNGKI